VVLPCHVRLPEEPSPALNVELYAMARAYTRLYDRLHADVVAGDKTAAQMHAQLHEAQHVMVELLEAKLARSLAACPDGAVK